MNIKENLITVNPMSRPGNKLDSVSKIVVHYVQNPGSTAMQNRNYFENLKNQNKVYASAHYIIDLNGDIIKVVPEDEVTYNSGNMFVNKNSISIENTHPDVSGKFTKETYNSLVELLADIVKRYNLDPMKDIIRHYDVTKKPCPLYYVNNKEEFNKLKEDVAQLVNK